MRLTLLLIIAGLFISSCTDSAVSTLNELNVNDSTLANETKKDSLENVNQSSIDSLKAIADSIANSTVIDTIIETTPEDSASDVVKDEPKNETSSALFIGTWKITKMTTKVGSEAEVEDESLAETGGDNFFVISADSMYMVSEMVSPLDPTAGKIQLLIMTQYYTIDETTITVTEEDGTVSKGDYVLNGSILTLTNVEADTTETITLEKSATAISTKGLMTMEAFMMQMFQGLDN